LEKELRDKIEEVVSLIKDHEIWDYSSPDVIWDEDAGYIIENEGSILEDLVWNGLTESESKTMLKDYKEELKKATKLVNDLIEENLITSEDEIWDYIDEDDDDFYDDED
jgi:hypothetical protein